MQITAHPFHYVFVCESCGNTITISYRDLRGCFAGSVPDEEFLKRSLLCVCELPQPEIAPSPVVPLSPDR